MLPGGAALEMNPEVDSPEPQIHEAKATTPPPSQATEASHSHLWSTSYFGPSASTLRHT